MVTTNSSKRSGIDLSVRDSHTATVCNFINEILREQKTSFLFCFLVHFGGSATLFGSVANLPKRSLALLNSASFSLSLSVPRHNQRTVRMAGLFDAQISQALSHGLVSSTLVAYSSFTVPHNMVTILCNPGIKLFAKIVSKIASNYVMHIVAHFCLALCHIHPHFCTFSVCTTIWPPFVHSA